MKTQQAALTVFVPLLPGSTDRARQTLVDIGRNLDKLSLRHSSSTHFARFVIVQGSAGKPDRLLFTSNYDGDEPHYLAELVETCGACLDEIFIYCEGYSKGDATKVQKFARFIHHFKLESQLFFVSLPGLTARNIRRAGRTQELIGQIADAARPAFCEIRKLSDSSPRPHRHQSSSGLRKNPALMDRFLNWVAGIKTEGRNPNTIVPNRPDLLRFEDLQTQNGLTIVATVKKSFIRRAVLRGYLALGRLLYTLAPPWGSLSGITSIHFARWVITDGGDTLIFESNYDGSFDSYIDTFVDVTSAGLNVIWNSCVGYPERGCQDIESFKQIIRTCQAPVLVFYSAYPESTVKNIIANHTLDQAVRAFISTPDIDRVFEGSYEIND